MPFLAVSCESSPLKPLKNYASFLSLVINAKQRSGTFVTQYSSQISDTNRIEHASNAAIMIFSPTESRYERPEAIGSYSQVSALGSGFLRK